MAKKEKDPQGNEPVAPADQSKAALNSLLTSKEYHDKHYNFQPRTDWTISSGSLLLDIYLGGGIKPSLIRICGQNNEGKTPQTLEIVRQFLATVPNSKAFWVIAEGRGLSEENRGRCGLKFVYKPEDWDVGTVFVLESNIYELFIQAVKNLVKENPQDIRYCFVVDSIDGLILQSDAEKEITDNNLVAGAPKLSKKMLQSLSLGMFKFGHLMILISQVTAEIQKTTFTGAVIKGPNRGGEFSGGNSLLHGADWIFEFQKTTKFDYIYDTANGEWSKANPNAKTIGKVAKINLQKSSLESSRYVQVEYPIKFGRQPSGIWLEKEMVDKLIFLGLIEKKASWLKWEASLLAELKAKFPDIQEQTQGEHNMMKYLEEHPDIRDFIYPKAVAFSTAVLDTKN